MTSANKPPALSTARFRSLALTAALWLVPVDALGGSEYAEISNEELLRTIANHPRPERNFYLNDRRSDLLLASKLQQEGKESKLSAGDTRVLALELLRAGRTRDAINLLDSIFRDAAGAAPGDPGSVDSETLRLLALAYLRLGEQANCIDAHHAASCLFPVPADGVHGDPEGSRQAIRYLGHILSREPEDLEARWLLNVAHMTLGRYPRDVPVDFLIPPEAFAAEREMARFHDIAVNAGINHVGLAGGSAVEDFNGDGWLDIAVTDWHPAAPMKLFLNRGDGTFKDATVEANLARQLGGLNLIHGDYDNDGDVDLFILRGAWLGTLGETLGNHPNSLLDNDGQGKFTDVTIGAGLRDLHPAHSAAWVDFDRDGLLDLFIGNESSRDPDAPGVINAHRYQLFRNNGRGGFVDVAKLVGLDGIGFVKGITWGDYNNDQLPDLYVSRLGQENQLFRNDGLREGVWRFTDVTVEAGVGEPRLSFPTWFWDYDNDGWEDIFVASYASFFRDDLGLVVADYLGKGSAEHSRLYRNNGDGTFDDVTRQSGLQDVLLAMGANFGDIDADGYQDFYVGTGQPALATLVPNRMYLNESGARFHDVTTSAGVGHLQKGHGVSFADLDNDGDLDIHAVMGGAYSGDVYANVLFENPGHDNNWLGIELRGSDGSNRLGVGARYEVSVLENGTRRLIRGTFGTGGSFGSNPHRQFIGLGQTTWVEELRITWPDRSGTIQVVADPPMNRWLRIKQTPAG